MLLRIMAVSRARASSTRLNKTEAEIYNYKRAASSKITGAKIKNHVVEKAPRANGDPLFQGVAVLRVRAVTRLKPRLEII